jgi:hypothetical protein
MCTATDDVILRVRRSQAMGTRPCKREGGDDAKGQGTWKKKQNRSDCVTVTDESWRLFIGAQINMNNKSY